MLRHGLESQDTHTHFYKHTRPSTRTPAHALVHVPSIPPHAGRVAQRPASASAASPSAQRAPQGPNLQLTIKATLGNESKLVTAPLTVSYYELLQAVKAKYPDAGRQAGMRVKGSRKQAGAHKKCVSRHVQNG
eukprot:1155224-Pelagomonas_calceolata.AAC.7